MRHITVILTALAISAGMIIWFTRIYTPLTCERAVTSRYFGIDLPETRGSYRFTDFIETGRDGHSDMLDSISCTAIAHFADGTSEPVRYWAQIDYGQDVIGELMTVVAWTEWRERNGITE